MCIRDSGRTPRSTHTESHIGVLGIGEYELATAGRIGGEGREFAVE